MGQPDSIRETRLDLVTRLYSLEAELANVEEAIAALDAVMPETADVKPIHRLRRDGSPVATAVEAILMERKRPVHASEIIQLLGSRGVRSRNPRSSVATALARLTRRGLARRVAPGTYEWSQLDVAEAIAERVDNIIPFAPRATEAAHPAEESTAAM